MAGVLVHDIGTARLLCGDIASVYAEGARRNPNILGEDHAILTLRHVNSTIGWVDSNSFLNHEDGGLDEATFEGESGSIRLNRLGALWSGDRKIWTAPRTGYPRHSVYPP